MLDHEGKELQWNKGYKYFGAAKDLPGVRELFEPDPPKPIKKTRAEYMRYIKLIGRPIKCFGVPNYRTYTVKSPKEALKVIAYLPYRANFMCLYIFSFGYICVYKNLSYKI